jgi:hypothetical protein
VLLKVVVIDNIPVRFVDVLGFIPKLFDLSSIRRFVLVLRGTWQ